MQLGPEIIAQEKKNINSKTVKYLQLLLHYGELLSSLGHFTILTLNFTVI